MRIFLNETVCKSFTGQLSKKYGYAVRKQRTGFYLMRCSKNKVNVLPDGHLRSIFGLAQMARNGLLITEVKCHVDELINALQEAHKWVAAGWLEANKNNVPHIYHARDILNFKTTFSL